MEAIGGSCCNETTQKMAKKTPKEAESINFSNINCKMHEIMRKRRLEAQKKRQEERKAKPGISADF